MQPEPMTSPSTFRKQCKQCLHFTVLALFAPFVPYASLSFAPPLACVAPAVKLSFPSTVLLVPCSSYLVSAIAHSKSFEIANMATTTDKPTFPLVSSFADIPIIAEDGVDTTKFLEAVEALLAMFGT